MTHRVVRGTLLACGRPDGRLTALSTAEQSDPQDYGGAFVLSVCGILWTEGAGNQATCSFAASQPPPNHLCFGKAQVSVHGREPGQCLWNGLPREQRLYL